LKPEPRRVLITGSNGLLGQKLADLLTQSQSYSVHLTSSQEEPVLAADPAVFTRLDITDRRAVAGLVDRVTPSVIVNTAAMTNVDRCETNREQAWRTNVQGVENLVHAAKLTGAHIVQVSTDYVFDGRNGPYAEDDRPNPLSYYGRTKLASENLLRTSGVNHTIVRTMVLYGQARRVKVNFALWLVRELQAGKSVRVAEDQVGSPTLADDLAFGIVRIIELNRQGVYHLSGPDVISRLEFARRLARVFRLDAKLIGAVKTAELNQAAPRPLKSGFIILKAATELNVSMSGSESGLKILKNQLTSLGNPVEITR